MKLPTTSFVRDGNSFTSPDRSSTGYMGRYQSWVLVDIRHPGNIPPHPQIQLDEVKGASFLHITTMFIHHEVSARYVDWPKGRNSAPLRYKALDENAAHLQQPIRTSDRSERNCHSLGRFYPTSYPQTSFANGTRLRVGEVPCFSPCPSDLVLARIYCCSFCHRHG